MMLGGGGLDGDGVVKRGGNSEGLVTSLLWLLLRRDRKSVVEVR
jgi:hypothetical protein